MSIIKRVIEINGIISETSNDIKFAVGGAAYYGCGIRQASGYHHLFDHEEYDTVREYADAVNKFHGMEVIDKVREHNERIVKKAALSDLKNGLYIFDVSSHGDYYKAFQSNALYSVGSHNANIQSLRMTDIVDTLNVIQDTAIAFGSAEYTPVVSIDGLVLDANLLREFSWDAYCNRDSCEIELKKIEESKAEAEKKLTPVVTTYTVKWDLDVDATTPEQAAKIANDYMFAPRAVPAEHDGVTCGVWQDGKFITEQYID